jgi:hypothetical protein
MNYIRTRPCAPYLSPLLSNNSAWRRLLPAALNYLAHTRKIQFSSGPLSSHYMTLGLCYLGLLMKALTYAVSSCMDRNAFFLSWFGEVQQSLFIILNARFSTQDSNARNTFTFYRKVQ